MNFLKKCIFNFLGFHQEFLQRIIPEFIKWLLLEFFNISWVCGYTTNIVELEQSLTSSRQFTSQAVVFYTLSLKLHKYSRKSGLSRITVQTRLKLFQTVFPERVVEKNLRTAANTNLCRRKSKTSLKPKNEFHRKSITRQENGIHHTICHFPLLLLEALTESHLHKSLDC